MLDLAMTFLKEQLQSYLVARTAAGSPDPRTVKLTPLVNDQGRYAIAQDTVGLTLVNIEEERTFKAQVPTWVTVGGRQVAREPEIRLNLHVLAAVNFTDYAEGLRYLSLVIAFFQLHPSFGPDDFPSLDPRIGSLTAELYSMGYEQINQLWGFVGGKQLPSVVYRVRVVTVQDEEIMSIGAPITTITATLGSR
jgi:Pvc16 N-terminal domain